MFDFRQRIQNDLVILNENTGEVIFCIPPAAGKAAQLAQIISQIVNLMGKDREACAARNRACLLVCVASLTIAPHLALSCQYRNTNGPF
jgi:hypothetical protein